jgi:nucleotide-binding universal stress UspA family protein
MPDLKVVIPLDGTNLSESALSVLPALKPLGTLTVRLVSVWEAIWEGPEPEASAGGDRMKEMTEQGHSYLSAYLKQQVERVQAMGCAADYVIRQGRPAEEVLEEVHIGDVDLVVIATHGRTGIERFRLGSIADKIVRASECPTLVIGPNVHNDLGAYAIRKITVPLDGSEIAEAALPITTYLAKAVGASIELVRAVTLPTMTSAAGMEAGNPQVILEMLEEAAESYMARIKSELKTGQPVETNVVLGASAEEVLRYLREHPTDLVVMTSRGRGGIARAALGSVTDRVLHGPAPVLVLRPEMEGRASRLIEAARAG